MLIESLWRDKYATLKEYYLDKFCLTNSMDNRLKSCLRTIIGGDYFEKNSF
jgi:hypothetical protein